MDNELIEKRHSARERNSDPLLWQRFGKDKVETGWLLERSEKGFAFAWRGTRRPKINTIFEYQIDLGNTNSPKRKAIVRRVARCHHDMCVIGAEVVTSRPYPASTTATASAPKSEVVVIHSPLRLTGGAVRKAIQMHTPKQPAFDTNRK